jgi:DNA-binding NtrC family response regulator
MGGRELARQLESIHPELRVIYMSGYTQDAALYDDAEAEQITFLQKPFTPNDVLQTIRAVLAPASAEQTAVRRRPSLTV